VTTLLRIAWRNLWRNPRRTGLTAAATVFAIVLTIWTLSLAAGSHERWIDTIVRIYPGHVEVSADGYRENRTLDYGMRLSDEGRRELEALPKSTGWAPRLESWALAIPDREGSLGRAAWLVGVDPVREQGLSRLPVMISEGRFLDGEPGFEVLLGETLARNLDASIGDSIILLSTDYYGSQSADRFRLVGTLSVGDPTIDAYAAFVRLVDLQRFLEFEGGLSHVALFSEKSDETASLAGDLVRVFEPGEYEVTAWPELIPEVVQLMILDDIGAWITMGILIVVVAFGILNTILMSVFERVREFGVLRAIGMRPRAVFSLVLAESALLALLGIAIGIAIAIPLVLWFEQNPIPMTGESYQAVAEVFRIEPVIVFAFRASHFVVTPLIIFVVAMLSALPPALRASRGRPVDALREV
jgi:ABC-type lipoprotein release transport system permease subunit